MSKRGSIIHVWAFGIVCLLTAAARGQNTGTGATTAPSTQPAAPLFVPDSSTEQITPPSFDTNKFIAEGNFPGSIFFPSTKTTLQVGGFVQLDAITDNNNIGSKDSFIVSSIPTGPQSAGQTTFSVRQTRLFFKTSTPTSWGDFVTYVEGDFFSSSGTDFRIRHAYGQIGDKLQFLAGQTWTTFMDASVYPAIFDYQGPNAMVLVRQPLIRFTDIFSDDAQFAVAVEDPNADLSSDPSVTGHSTSLWPDFASNIRWSPAWGHLQLAGIMRELIFDPTVGSRTTHIGFGLNFTGQVKLGKSIATGKQDNIVFQATGGEGIENYINDTAGLGFDGFFNADGQISGLSVWGGFLAYQHYWSPKWGSSLGYSYLRVNNSPDQSNATYHGGQYLVGNLIFNPVERVALGLEGLYGVREDKDGSTGNDIRVSFSAQFRF